MLKNFDVERHIWSWENSTLRWRFFFTFDVLLLYWRWRFAWTSRNLIDVRNTGNSYTFIYIYIHIHGLFLNNRARDCRVPTPVSERICASSTMFISRKLSLWGIPIRKRGVWVSRKNIHVTFSIYCTILPIILCERKVNELHFN